ncbi:MAG: penicillin-binding protein 2 [Akkermansiaceae bacterium]|nr:penicillin-binding protein 2 [Akkermansiaceae bacterium]
MDSNSLHKRSFCVTLILVIAFSVLSIRIVYIQIVGHERFSEIAKAERMAKTVLPASRGQIYDRNGESLVQNQHVRDVIADRYHLEDIHVCRRAVAASEDLSVREISQRYNSKEVRERFIDLAESLLNQTLGIKQGALQEIVNNNDGRDRVVIFRSLDFIHAEKVKELMRERKIGGFRFEDSMRRYYPKTGRLVQVLGYTDAENVGREGIESTLNLQLAGVPGYRLVERTRRSSEVLSEYSKEVQPINGSNVELTIDMGLQNIVEQQLELAVREYDPEKIMAVFMDPGTGEILSMASRPQFNQFTREGVRKIHPVADRYEPGSTFKIVSLSAAFDRGLITPDSNFFCHNGRYREPGVTLRDHRAYGYLSAEEILAKSSNIGVYMLAKKIGRHTFHSYIKDFGFTRRTGVELTAESSGTVTRPDSKGWSKTSLSRIAMGYEVDVTALQMVNALCVIANGGTLYQPQIIQRITSQDGLTMYRFQPKKIRRVIHEGAANKVRNALMAVVSKGGTGTKAQVDGFQVAGKTGTAKKPKDPRNQGYHDRRYVVSFMGFLPAENPRLAGIIIVDDPQNEGSRYGGTVAAPIFSKIAAAAMPYLGIDPRKATRSLGPSTGQVLQGNLID